jgi:hypothetical protein
MFITWSGETSKAIAEILSLIQTPSTLVRLRSESPAC